MYVHIYFLYLAKSSAETDETDGMYSTSVVTYCAVTHFKGIKFQRLLKKCFKSYFMNKSLRICIGKLSNGTIQLPYYDDTYF